MCGCFLTEAVLSLACPPAFPSAPTPLPDLLVRLPGCLLPPQVEVHTPFTTRAKELMQLYNGLNLPMLTIDERLDVLLHVKWTVKVWGRFLLCAITTECEMLQAEAGAGAFSELEQAACLLACHPPGKLILLRPRNAPITCLSTDLLAPCCLAWLRRPQEFDCNLTREIVELIDREADLLNRGRSPKMLEGLRKRISSLFLTFVETPEFNPEAARYQVCMCVGGEMADEGCGMCVEEGVG